MSKHYGNNCNTLCYINTSISFHRTKIIRTINVLPKHKDEPYIFSLSIFEGSLFKTNITAKLTIVIVPNVPARVSWSAIANR